MLFYTTVHTRNSRKCVFKGEGNQHNFTQVAPNELKLGEGGYEDESPA